jgi:hypothetical protein
MVIYVLTSLFHTERRGEEQDDLYTENQLCVYVLKERERDEGVREVEEGENENEYG